MQPSSHSLAEGIRKHGFRKWYERQLLSGHAHMVLAFLSVIGLVGAMEVSQGATPQQRIVDVLIILVCAGLGLWALRRYLYLLMHAEAVANQATCTACGTYGRLRLVPDEEPREGAQVCCARCGHTWTLMG